MSPSVKKAIQPHALRESFSTLYGQGMASVDDIDDFVDIWHEGGTGISLHDFLGLSKEEYARWVERPDSLEATLKGKKHKDSLRVTDQAGARRAAILLKQISDPTRLQVLLRLDEGEIHVTSLCSELQQSTPALIHHLALLRHSRLIAPQRRGKTNYYLLTNKGKEIVKIIKTLLS